MSTTDDVTDETPQDNTPDPATWDAQAWLAGATSTVRSVTIHGRPDLVAQVDELREQVRLAERINDDDRALGDPTPDSLYAQAAELLKAWEASAVTVRVEGRSESRRQAIDKRLKKAGIASDDKGGEQTLAYLADAIVSPSGIDAGWLRTFREKSEPQYNLLFTAFVQACGAPPVVTVPFSRGGSGDRKRGTSS